MTSAIVIETEGGRGRKERGGGGGGWGERGGRGWEVGGGRGWSKLNVPYFKAWSIAKIRVIPMEYMYDWRE